MKCPYYIRKVSEMDWNGIKCEKYFQGTFYWGKDDFTKESRDKWINEKCCNDFKNCTLYSSKP